jgi:hypothetical protein
MVIHSRILCHIWAIVPPTPVTRETISTPRQQPLYGKRKNKHPPIAQNQEAPFSAQSAVRSVSDCVK